MSNALTRGWFVRKAANDVEMDVRDGLVGIPTGRLTVRPDRIGASTVGM